MVYSNKFVLAILVNGKPQPELANGVVQIPLGAEYALRFKNKNDRRAVVKIFIDGENVSGEGYVISARGDVDIKRHHDHDRSFKFVALDSGEAVAAGKNGPNDDKTKGVIEARFYLEKQSPPVQEIHHHHHHDHYHPPVYPKPWWPHRPYEPIWVSDAPKGPNYCGDVLRTCSINDSPPPVQNRCDLEHSTTDFDGSEMCKSAVTGTRMFRRKLKDGCTVEGGTTGQNFTTIWIDLEETYTSLKVFLQGYESEVETIVARKPRRKVRWTAHQRWDATRLKELEAENEELRRKLAEEENRQLKEQLEKVTGGQS